MWPFYSWTDCVVQFSWLYFLFSLMQAIKGRPLKKVGDENIDRLELIELMKAPRCSKLTFDLNGHQRDKRFVAHVTKWNHTDIRWKFRDPFGIFQNQTDFDIARETLFRAFSMWSLASKHMLRFNEYKSENMQNNTDDIDIDIFFAIGDHGDHEPFDGRGGIVAHSGYPPVGKIHFDASEQWMINGDAGIDLRYVVLHETGHALGLRHSKHRDAIMHPIYRTKSEEIALSDDDIKGIRYLYPIDNSIQKIDTTDVRQRNRINIAKKPVHIDFEELVNV